MRVTTENVETAGLEGLVMIAVPSKKKAAFHGQVCSVADRAFKKLDKGAADLATYMDNGVGDAKTLLAAGYEVTKCRCCGGKS